MSPALRRWTKNVTVIKRAKGVVYNKGGHLGLSFSTFYNNANGSSAAAGELVSFRRRVPYTFAAESCIIAI